jgi:hypothetical protein
LEVSIQKIEGKVEVDVGMKIIFREEVVFIFML